jgi:hypothetical protein
MSIAPFSTVIIIAQNFVIQFKVVGESQAKGSLFLCSSQCKLSEQKFCGSQFLDYVEHSHAELL